MPWQIPAAQLIGATDGNGRMLFPYVVVHVPRRAGKTILTLATLLQRAAKRKQTLCWYSAQTRDAAASAFRKEWVPLLAASPLHGPGLRLRKSNGSEEVTILHHGVPSSSVALYAPTATALHGSDADLVAQDEGWAFTADQGADIESGVQPAQLTRPERQLLIVSAGGTEYSTWLQHWMTLATDGVPGVAMIDYGAPAGSDPDDPAVWAAVHPAVGQTIDLQGIAGMRATMPDAEFQRAVLNIWRPQVASVDPVIPPELWLAAASPDAQLASAGLRFAVDVSRSGAAVFAAASRDDTDTITAEIIGVAHSTPDAVRMWRELRDKYRARLVIDKLSGAATLAEALQRAGYAPHIVTTGEYAAGCADTLQRIKLGQFRHRSQPLLDSSAASTRARPIGDRWVWDRRTGDAAPVVAVSLAAYDTRRARTRASSTVQQG
jgi:hypothetical protein